MSAIRWIKIQDLDEKEAHKHGVWFLRQTPGYAEAQQMKDFDKRANPKERNYRTVEEYNAAPTLILFSEKTRLEDGDALVATGHGVYQAFMSAYSRHEGVVISPDDVWLAVQLVLCKYIEAHAEQLRTLFVSHQGKKKLEVDMIAYDWPKFMRLVVELIKENTKADAVKMPQFSSSTEFDVTMKQLAVMDAMKSYFEYTCRFCCGIPRVGFKGTIQDWQLLKTTVTGLRAIAVNGDELLIKWADTVVSVIEQFVLTLEGNVSTSFWNSIFNERVQGGSGGSTYIHGWLNALLVMDYNKELDVGDIPASRFTVPVKVDDNGHKFNVTIVGGLNGTTYNPTEKCWSVSAGYAVVKEDSEQ